MIWKIATKFSKSETAAEFLLDKNVENDRKKEVENKVTTPW